MSITPRNGSSGSRLVTTVLALLVGIVGIVVTPSAASAHTDFGSSTPADGAVVVEPVSVVTIEFTGSATAISDGFTALTADGTLQQPIDVQAVDGTDFVLTFDPPLAGGPTGLRWSIQSADGHVLEGSFSFTVDAPIPTTTPTTVPPTTALSTTGPTPTDAPATVAAPTTIDPDAASPAASGSAADPAEQSLDEFLDVDGTRPGEGTARIGRIIGFLGLAVGIGALVFLAAAMRGSREEFGQLVTAIRVLGVAVAAGAAIEYVGIARIAGDSLGESWSTNAGLAAVLRLIGGMGLAAGVVATTAAAGRPRPLSSAVADQVSDRRDGRAEDADGRGAGERQRRWVAGDRSRLAFTGVLLIVASFWFDGHTVTKGFRPLHALLDSIHVVAGAVWVGGVVTLAALVWSRARAGRQTRIAELALRFSKVATIALVAVALAGVAMAVLVLDSFGDLTGSSWGQHLLLKSGAVAIAASAGAYNHFRLLPVLDEHPRSPEHLDRLRNVLLVEAAALIVVVVITTSLVVAAT